MAPPKGNEYRRSVFIPNFTERTVNRSTSSDPRTDRSNRSDESSNTSSSASSRAYTPNSTYTSDYKPNLGSYSSNSSYLSSYTPSRTSAYSPTVRSSYRPENFTPRRYDNYSSFSSPYSSNFSISTAYNPSSYSSSSSRPRAARTSYLDDPIFTGTQGRVYPSYTSNSSYVPRISTGLSYDTRKLLSSYPSYTSSRMLLERRKAAKENGTSFGEPFLIATASIPAELLFDIFLTMPRNEIEKCQLICRHWFHMISNFVPHLPLHLFYRLRIGEEEEPDENAPPKEPKSDLLEPLFMIRHVGGVERRIDEYLITKPIINALKYVTFVSCGPTKLRLTTYTSVRWLTELAACKIHTMVFATFGPNYDRLAECAVLLPKILEDCVLTNKLTIVMDEEEVLKLLISPKTLRLPMNISEINLNLDTFDFKTTDRLIEFLESCDLTGAQRYSMKLCNINNGPRFIDKILEIFNQSEKPEGFLKQILFTSWPSRIFDLTVDQLNAKNLESSSLIKDNVVSFFYEVYRPDELKMEIIFRKKLEGEKMDCIADFKIKKM